MNFKMKLKMSIDLLMTVSLLFLMAYQITGPRRHEELGTGMLVLFLLHNFFNIRWYGNLHKGSYKPLRILQTAVNLSVLASMLCLGFSGIVLSRYVFEGVGGPMAMARSMHLAASYWGFVLMSVHLGMHWGMILGMFRKFQSGRRMPAAAEWALRGAAAAFVGYGLYCFVTQNIVSYMFLRTQFVFFDFEEPSWRVLAELVSMMGFWGFIGFYAAKAAGRFSSIRPGPSARRSGPAKRK